MPGFWLRFVGNRRTARSISSEKFQFSTLSSGKGTFSLLWRDGIEPAPAWCLREPPHEQRVLLCVPDSDRWVGWLMAPDAAPLAIEGAPLIGPVVPVRIRRPAGQGMAILTHPLEPNLWLAPRGQAREPERKITFGAGNSAQEAVLQLNPIPLASVSLDIVATARRLAGLVEPPYAFSATLDALRSGAIRPSLVEPLLALLSVDELGALATHLLTHAKDLQAVRAAIPKDRWLAGRLASLIDWRGNRTHPSPKARKVAARMVDDLPGRKDTLAVNPTLGTALVTLARRATPPRFLACVLGSARNEGPYLLEWIAHHRAIGFDHIFLYSNDNTDGSDALLRLLAEAGRITWVDQEIGSNTLPQFRAYAHALSVLPETLDYRWTLIVDLDEFFCFDIERFNSARDFLLWQDHRGAEAVAMPWLVFVARPQDNWQETPCIERFPLREETVNHHIKSVFRTNRFWSANCHHPNAILRQNFEYLAETGLRHIPKSPEHSPSLSQNPQAKHAFVAHYIYRSAPEALAKIARGRGDGVRGVEQQAYEQMMGPLVALSEKRRLITDTRPLACATGLSAELSSLRAIPGVADCEAEIKKHFASQLAVWQQQVLRRGAGPGESEACAVFRRYLQETKGDNLPKVAESLFG